MTERLIAQIDAVGGEEIESDECGGRLPGELLHARSRRVQPHLQGVEVQAARRRDDDLAVEDTAGRQLRVEDVVQLGKVAVERPQVAALNVDVVRAAKDQRAKAIPLRLEQKSVALRNFAHRFRQHRLDRRAGTLNRDSHS